jgi:lysophospholipase L1-like esterase
MRGRLLGLVAVLSLVAALVFPALANAATATAPYYLSLGDSLAQGVQPNSAGQSVITNQGYADDLYSLERFQVRGLQLEKLGCPGETTTTMISGGVCNNVYQSGNQLSDAVAFLQTHKVAFVTIDIGANNVDGCLSGATVDQTCVVNGLTAAGHDLPIILGTLRAAAPGVPIFAMNYYDPFLAAWLQGAAGHVLAQQSVALAGTFNALLGGIYGAFSVPVADVSTAFQTTNFNVLPFVGLPVNVAAVCSLTWMCAPAPVGPNIHANRLGYWLIATTFARAIGLRL